MVNEIGWLKCLQRPLSPLKKEDEFDADWGNALKTQEDTEKADVLVQKEE